MQSVDLIDTPRPSVVVELDAQARLIAVTCASTIAEIVRAVGDSPALVVVDAPLVVANELGQRDVERILAWCDVPTFPISQTRLRKVFGGIRGVELRDALPSASVAFETHPDLVLRLLLWEDAHGAAAIDLADYRAAWLGIRAPRYRPKGPGHANPAGIAAAAALLARHVDLCGWTPSPPADDWVPIRDAAVLDAVTCGYTAHRAVTQPDAALTIGSPGRGRLLVAVDANLRRRLESTIARLRAEGSISADTTSESPNQTVGTDPGSA